MFDRSDQATTVWSLDSEVEMGSKSSCEDESPSRSREKTKLANWFFFGSSRSPASTPTARSSPKSGKNVFQRMKKEFRKRFPSNRGGNPTVFYDDNGDDDIDHDHGGGDERDGGVECGIEGAFAIIEPTIPMESDERRKYLKKKWMDVENPNVVMYRACMEMLSYAWYWGEISRHEAQRQLTDKPNGSFLIRDSEKDGSQFTLSFRMWNRTLHYRIQHHDNYWHFESRKYESMVEMVENFMNRSDHEMFFVQRTSDIMPPFPVVLRYPVSRYLKFVTLQELCRRVIQRNLNEAGIENLPLPPQLREYLLGKDAVGVR